MNTLARFFYFNQSKYYRKASESILSMALIRLLSRYNHFGIHKEWNVDRSYDHSADSRDKAGDSTPYR